MMNDIALLQRSAWCSGDAAASCSSTQPCLGWEAEQGRAPEAGESDTLFVTEFTVSLTNLSAVAEQ